MQLSTARIFVNDLQAAEQFYVATLGLPLKAQDERLGYCVLDAGTAQIVIETVSADAPAEDRSLVGRFTGLSFAVTDIQNKYIELLAKGVSFSGMPERQAWGGTLATCLDPSGNELQLVQHA